MCERAYVCKLPLTFPLRSIRMLISLLPAGIDQVVITTIAHMVCLQIER